MSVTWGLVRVPNPLRRPPPRYSALLSQMLPTTTTTTKLPTDNKPSITSTSSGTITSFVTEKPSKESTLEPGASFVNLSALKQIYHKEGGVWWGSDEKPTGAVGRGDEAEDEVFREAEKLGIDIRPSSLFGGVQGGQVAGGVGGGDGSNGNSGSGMLFGFFDSVESDTGAGLNDSDGMLLGDTVGTNVDDRNKFTMDWTNIVEKALRFSRVG